MPLDDEEIKQLSAEIVRRGGAITHPCFWAEWVKEAAIVGGGAGAAKTAVREGVNSMSAGQKVLGGMAAFDKVKSYLGPFASITQPFDNWWNKMEASACNALSF
jgi:hypothetical protein